MSGARVWIGVMQDGVFHPDEEREYDALVRKALDGHEVEQITRKRRSTRTLRQNRWLHSFLGKLAEHLGYELEELKLVGLIAVFGTKVVGGYTIPEQPHTSQLNTEQFSDLCEWFVQKAAEVDFLVLYPQEFKREKRKQERAVLKKTA